MYVGEQITLTNIDKKELEKFVDECNKKLIQNILKKSK